MSKRTATGYLKIALTQMACGRDAKVNLTRQLGLLDRAGRQGAKILCTQELFRTQYFCQMEKHEFFKLAETIPGPSTDAIAKVANILWECAAVSSHPLLP